MLMVNVYNFLTQVKGRFRISSVSAMTSIMAITVKSVKIPRWYTLIAQNRRLILWILILITIFKRGTDNTSHKMTSKVRDIQIKHRI